MSARPTAGLAWEYYRLTRAALPLLAPALVGSILLWIFWAAPSDQWTLPNIDHPLGTDEFGRDLLATALAATGLSLLKGIAITAGALAMSIVAAELVTLRRASLPSAIARAVANIVESVPVVLWIFIVIVAVPGPRFLVVAVAFSLVVLPIATHLLAGEFFRLRAAPYVEAAYHLGAGELRVLIRYILPNAAAVVVPFGLQVLGAAIAVDGAIGVIGARKPVGSGPWNLSCSRKGELLPPSSGADCGPRRIRSPVRIPDVDRRRLRTGAPDLLLRRGRRGSLLVGTTVGHARKRSGHRTFRHRPRGA